MFNSDFLIKELTKGALHAAPFLLGKELIYQNCGGIISEVEAYIQTDPASHTFRGESVRNKSMFAKAGTIYIYRSYGIHWCMNIVTGVEGEGEGVLIRSIISTLGIEEMRQRRKVFSDQNLTNGPGKVTQALGVDLSLNGVHLSEGIIQIEKGIEIEKKDIQNTPRIGISKGKEFLRRWLLKK